ncbi:phage major capsid protein [Candidatus Anaplasma sp. TIGMIC]|uniref:phage major capsid protein n=1 Tax=Candidatus Anaplasma sp. TIGMIC TaxID=3020713 RepID=UPI00232E16C7|nr:phage major capsid protein [Candidatus Anaplasma sp. TIGMIC]MDB1135098.1 phage major capsid protein [Candidatus Anaplasma sp. TIGMIC]
MTIPPLEVKDGITEFFPQDTATHHHISHEDEMENIHSSSDEILKLLGNINCKFDDCSKRLDKIEATHNYINLNEEPDTLQCKSLREYISTGASYSDMERKSSYTGTPFSYLVPRKFILHIDKLLEKSSVMRKLCSVEKISGESMEYLTTDNRNTFVGWSNNEGGPDAATTAPTMKSVTISLCEMYAQPQISQKLLNDASINLEDWLISNLVDAFCRTENRAFISGNGDKQPLGIMSYLRTIPPRQTKKGTSSTAPENITKHSKGDQTPKSEPTDSIDYVYTEQLTADSLIELYYSLDEYFASRASFIMHRSVLQKIRSLKTASGQYLLQQGPTGEELIMGIPVYQTSDMPEVNSTTYPAVALADFKSAYKIVENSDLRVLRDPYTSKAFVKFYVTKRIGGALINKNAIKMLKIGAPESQNRTARTSTGNTVPQHDSAKNATDSQQGGGTTNPAARGTSTEDDLSVATGNNPPTTQDTSENPLSSSPADMPEERKSADLKKSQ